MQTDQRKDRMAFRLCVGWIWSILLPDWISGSFAYRKLSNEALVPLLRWFRPRSAYYHFCVIYKRVILNKSSHVFQLNAYTAVGSCVLGHTWEIMKRNASALHKPRNVGSARIAVKPSLEAFHCTRSFRSTFGTRPPTCGVIIAIETF